MVGRYVPDVLAANGQGRTPDEARDDLIAAIELVLEDLREEAFRSAPPDAVRATVAVG